MRVRGWSRFTFGTRLLIRSAWVQATYGVAPEKNPTYLKTLNWSQQHGRSPISGQLIARAAETVQTRYRGPGIRGNWRSGRGLTIRCQPQKVLYLISTPPLSKWWMITNMLDFLDEFLIISNYRVMEPIIDAASAVSYVRGVQNAINVVSTLEVLSYLWMPEFHVPS